MTQNLEASYAEFAGLIRTVSAGELRIDVAEWNRSAVRLLAQRCKQLAVLHAKSVRLAFGYAAAKRLGAPDQMTVLGPVFEGVESSVASGDADAEALIVRFR
ncbi:hypothetical protein EYW49_17805 [Siculibacillus lacustris]|uniref:Uncharacterized protein n=1 Tax=Siculibacillus lacustris TaxID=1549641 RepID=A0A4Q9VJJ5_9HYPH|nr:hypothetical protein [Siculibacillus lacustris]TBW34603.1 hypothetical protein EYW49_17805 [Siculibacillus lacustris]